MIFFHLVTVSLIMSILKIRNNKEQEIKTFINENIQNIIQNVVEFDKCYKNMNELIKMQIKVENKLLMKMSTLLQYQMFKLLKNSNGYDLVNFFGLIIDIHRFSILESSILDERLEKQGYFYNKIASKKEPKKFTSWYLLINKENIMNKTFDIKKIIRYSKFIEKRLGMDRHKNFKQLLFNFLLKKGLILENIMKILYEFKEITQVDESVRFNKTILSNENFRRNSVKYYYTSFPTNISFPDFTKAFFEACLCLRNNFYGMAGLLVIDSNENAYETAKVLYCDKEDTGIINIL